MRLQHWKGQRLSLYLQIFKLTKPPGKIYGKFIFFKKQYFYKSYQAAMNKAVNHFTGLSNGTLQFMKPCQGTYLKAFTDIEFSVKFNPYLPLKDEFWYQLKIFLPWFLLKEKQIEITGSKSEWF